MGAQVRIYVDDIALTAASKQPWGVVRALGFALPALKTYLMSRGMVLNDSKEQFYSPTLDVIHLWHRTHPAYLGKQSKQAKDLGSSQRGVGVASGTRSARLLQATGKFRKAKTLQSGPRSQKLIAKASVHAGALYGCELDPLTSKNVANLRTATAVALNCEWGAQ